MTEQTSKTNESSADRASLTPTPTASGLPYRIGDFSTVAQALDYAAAGASGCNFYSARGELTVTLPYTELRRRGFELAAKLAGLRFERGDRLGLVAETSPDFLIGFMGCHLAGLLPVPVCPPAAFADRAAYLEQIRGQMTQCGARILVGSDDFLAWIAGEDSPGAGMPRVLSWRDLHGLQETRARQWASKPEDICFLQYSSGSTRFPRGVAVSQRALLANCRAIARHGLQVRPGDRAVSWLPLYHDMGLVGMFFTALLCQVSIDLMAPEDFARRPAQWLRLISRNRGTVSYSPCFGYELCLRRNGFAQDADLDLESWRVAGVGGEMIRADVIERFAETFAPMGFRRSAILPSYGLAEATLAVSFAPLGRGLEIDVVDRSRLATEKRAVSWPGGRAFVRCGRVLPGHDMELRDEAGRPVPPRRIGRIFVRGDSVMQGYFNNAEATAEVMTSDGWLDTGDLGYLVDGELVVVGRHKDTIIVNGRNIWPQDIEWSVEQLPDIRSQDTAAFAVAGPHGAEEAVVLVQCRLRDPAARAALQASVRQAVRRSCGIECQVVLVPPHSLPRTSSGKLSRSRARENFLAGVYGGADEERLWA